MLERGRTKKTKKLGLPQKVEYHPCLSSRLLFGFRALEAHYDEPALRSRTKMEDINRGTTSNLRSATEILPAGQVCLIEIDRDECIGLTHGLSRDFGGNGLLDLYASLGIHALKSDRPINLFTHERFQSLFGPILQLWLLGIIIPR